jgi:NADPH-dependent curcumin reductase CurA
VRSRSIVLRRRPNGLPVTDDFELVEAQLPALGDGAFLARLLSIGPDAGVVSRLREGANYRAGIAIGEVIGSNGVAEVIATRNQDVEVGRLLYGPFGWREHEIRESVDGLFDVDPARPLTAPLGLLGLHGLTAYVGLLEIAKPRPGETVVVSAAAGAVGLIVGQLAKIHGCRVVGITGGPEKARRVVQEFGLDACVDYRAAEFPAQLSELCPEGVDIYFDNVGGDIQDAVVPLFNSFGRFVICGRIALTRLTNMELDVGRRDYNTVLVKELRKEGFLVYSHLHRLREAQEHLWRWHSEGRLELPESIVEGFERLPEAFVGMLAGENIGRRIVHIADPEHR